MFSRHGRARFRRSRQGFALVALMQYALLCTGVTVPLPALPIGGKPFPCQHHNCGCNTAEQCWRSCCCMTPEQRLEWARENGVTPPDNIMAQLVKLRTPKPKCSHCCSAKHDDASQKPVKNVAQAKPTTRWVSFFEAQKCLAGSADWTGVAWSVSPPRPLAVTFEACVEVVDIRSTFLPASPAYEPPSPPPRVG